MSVLADILESTRADIELRRRAAPETSLRGASDRAPRAFHDALAAPGLSIVAEHKRRSPSAGAIRPASRLTAEARERGRDVLVEVHDRAELDVALAVGAEIVGVNNRDLRDFRVDIERTFELLEAMPRETIVVAESGISTPRQLARLREHGVHAALIGERLMREDDPALALRSLLAEALAL